MTDLEKLAQEWLERYWGFKMKPGVGKRDLLPLLERARTAGRIEGLEEAASLVLGACPRCKGRGLDPSTSGIYGCTACFEPRQAIRDRIQELEGEK